MGRYMRLRHIVLITLTVMLSVLPAGAENPSFHTFVDTLFGQRAEITLYAPDKDRAQLEPTATACFQMMKKLEQVIGMNPAGDEALQKTLSAHLNRVSKIDLLPPVSGDLYARPLRDLWLSAAQAGSPPSDELLRKAVDDSHSQKHALDGSDASFVWNEPPRYKIDFYPFREGLLLDEARDTLRQNGHDFFLIGIGGVWLASVKT